MRKNIILITLIAAMALSGCSESNRASDIPDSIESNKTASVPDNGHSDVSKDMVYISENADYYKNGVVFGSEKAMFLDFDTMEKAPLCAVPNCTHTDSDCLAKIVGSTPVFYNDSIYYLSSNYGAVKETSDRPEFYIDSKLMKASLDSSETEAVCEFHDCAPPEKFGKYVLYKNELFFIGDDLNPVKDNYGGLSYGNSGGTHFLCSINLDTGEYTNYGSIYDGDKEYEASAYSSSAVISGIYNEKMYLGYTFVEDMKSLDSGIFEFTCLNFEFDFKTKTWKESELPYSRYMNNSTYTYFDNEEKQFHIIYNEKDIEIPYEYEVTNCSEFNGKLFMPDEGKWFDLTDSSEHSLGEYSGYQVVGYTDGNYILLNGGRNTKITEEQLLKM
ncbi:MAG: hypothetical protein ACI4JD_04790 [Ruminococcus sp.]